MNNEFFLIYLFNSLSENSLDLGGLYGAVSLRSYNLSLKMKKIISIAYTQSKSSNQL